MKAHHIETFLLWGITTFNTLTSLAYFRNMHKWRSLAIKNDTDINNIYEKLKESGYKV